MSFSYPESFFEEMKKQGRVASDSGPVTVGEQAEEQRKKREQTEAKIQEDLFELCAWKTGEYPPLRWIHAVPNGQYRRGQKPEPGMKAGVPDVHLPTAASGYHSLWLELKAPGKYPRPKQRQWIRALRQEGHAVRVVRSVEEAWATITDYLDGCLTPRKD